MSKTLYQELSLVNGHLQTSNRSQTPRTLFNSQTFLHKEKIIVLETKINEISDFTY